MQCLQHISVFRGAFCDGLEMKFTSPLGGIHQTVRQKQLRKALLLVLLSVSDCRRLDTRLYFIISYH